jgi:succinoglycan biosynthesis protein ExoA
MITVVCPTYNEEKFIEKVLQFYTSALPTEKELFVVDGGSTDNTIQIVKSYAEKDLTIHYLHNENKIVPFALNKAIKKAKGDVIIRLDAHSEYTLEYFTQILKTFDETKADIVGGPMRPRGKNTIQKAIAWATTTSFALGDSMFHNEKHKGWVDSVYLGAWKKEIFDEVGLFDENLKRNQDDEFHYRAKSLGKKIYLNPEIESIYYPRDSYKLLWKQYFQYGLYKPMVLKKVRSEIKLRHLIPSLFSLYLVSLLILGSYSFFFSIPLAFYISLLSFSVLKSANKTKVKVASVIVFPIIHLSYGIGFLLGLFKQKSY